MSEVVTLEGEAAETLDTLADRINGEHRACERAVVSAVRHAIAAGEMLLEAKEIAGHGNWGDWLRENFEGSERHAQRYMQIASRKDELNPTHVSDMSLRGALRELAAPVEPRRDEQETLEVYRELREEYGDRLTAGLIRRVVRPRLERMRREEEARRRTENQPPIDQYVVGEAEIRHCDFRDLNLPENSAHLILTDPPYPGEYLPLWRDLSHFAATTLRDGGLLVAYSGQWYLPTVMEYLSEELEYVWTGAVTLPGARNQVMGRQFFNTFKPILFYRKPGDNTATGRWAADSVESPGRTRELHPWQQSIEPFEFYVSRLTQPGELVVDPFLGSGTTAVAAHRAQRSFIGCDLDQKAVRTTRDRLDELDRIGYVGRHGTEEVVAA